MDETPKAKLTRFDIYKNETQIETLQGDFYNNTLCHRMKEKDTFKTVFPTSDLWKDEIIFKTTNQVEKPIALKDPYHDETYHFKRDFNTRYNEEMLKSKNMMSKKKKDAEKKPDAK
jgi:hypothetical protein